MRLFVLFLLIISIQFGLAQNRQLIIDSNIKPDLIFSKDTTEFPDFSDNTNTKKIKIAKNAIVKSDSNITLENSYIYNDSSKTIIILSSIDLGYNISLNITIQNNFYKTFFYINAVYIEGQELDVKDCELKLNTDNFKIGNLIVGQIKFSYDGQVYNREKNIFIRKSGEYYGYFKSTVDRKK
ncbi:MAG TPA: hypothetical protein PKK00_00055 [Bacteroidales bacterium]|nr:hypothetical protein [Bacteroidales bacterium]HPS16291.1 hypothetical protein [Bacteroidales bacterium]